MPLKLKKADVIKRLEDTKRKILADHEDAVVRWAAEQAKWPEKARKLLDSFINAYERASGDSDKAPEQFRYTYRMGHGNGSAWELPDLAPPDRPGLDNPKLNKINKLLDRLSMSADETVTITLNDDLNQFI